MLLKALAIVQSKAALAALGVVLVGGGGTAAAYAATSHPSSLTSSYAQATATAKPATMPAAKPATMPAAKPAPTQGATSTRAQTMAIKGVLKAYNAGAGTISVQVKGSTAGTMIVVNAKTRVNGVHVHMLGDLAMDIGHKVQVQANKQNDGKLVARTVTVQSAKVPATGNNPGMGNNAATGATPTAGTIPDVGDSPAMGTTPTTGNNPGMGNSHGNGKNHTHGNGGNSNG